MAKVIFYDGGDCWYEAVNPRTDSGNIAPSPSCQRGVAVIPAIGDKVFIGVSRRGWLTSLENLELMATGFTSMPVITSVIIVPPESCANCGSVEALETWDDVTICNACGWQCNQQVEKAEEEEEV